MKKLTKEIFIEKSKKIHGDKYDYSKVNYINTRTKVCIICPEHGEFWQNPKSHMMGYGCQKCMREVFDTKTFIEKSKKIHGDKYDYSKVEYKNSHTKVCIICPEHGEFWQNPCDHLHGYGCPKCGIKKLWDKRGRLNTDEFVKRSTLIHNNKYNYSKVECINTRTKVCIICPKHGEFWQTPKSHLNGCGCPMCRNSYLERKIESFLIEYKIMFEKEKSFPWLKNSENNSLFLDFYLPEYNVAIECQGIQHYIPIKNNIEKFNKIQYNDTEKLTKCVDNNLHIIYFSDEVICRNYADDKVFHSKEDILNEISRFRI